MRDDHANAPDDDSVVRAALERIDDFAPLYGRHVMAIHRYCFNQTRDVDVANDLTAQVFVRAIERLHQYRPRSGATFRSWLFAIARNIVVDRWRRQRPTRLLADAMRRVASTDPGPEEIAVHRSEIDRLAVALETLPAHYQDIIQLRLAGLTTSEIAATLATTEPSVKSAQTRAYRRLRAFMESNEGRGQ